MKKLMTALIAIALSIPVITLAQNTDQQNSNQAQQEQNQAAETSQMGTSTLPQHSMSGIVGDDGKTLTSGDTKYKVSNPHTLKKYEKQTVSVVYQFDTDKNAIHIVSVTPSGSR